jgi:hypothetical protein
MSLGIITVAVQKLLLLAPFCLSSVAGHLFPKLVAATDDNTNMERAKNEENHNFNPQCYQRSANNGCGKHISTRICLKNAPEQMKAK